MSNPEIMWSRAFAWNATNKNTIQEERQPSQGVQDATLNDGFPLITMTPQDAGGIAPNGQDMNGALYAISSNMVHRQKGLRIQFDPAYAAKIGGYDQGCILASSDYTRDYISLIPNNLTDPNGSGTAGRWAIYSGAGSISSATASIAGIVKIVDSLSSTATDAALTANQGKVLGDRTQQATVTNVGISRFANATEVSNKSPSNVAINPKNVVDMFSGNFLDNGSLTLPSGHILKWGVIPAISVGNNYSATQDFPLSFPNKCLIVICSSAAGNIGGSSASEGFQVNSWSKSGFEWQSHWQSRPSSFGDIPYFAIGY